MNTPTKSTPCQGIVASRASPSGTPLPADVNVDEPFSTIIAGHGPAALPTVRTALRYPLVSGGQAASIPEPPTVTALPSVRMARCVFCGSSGPMSNEHVVPQGLGEALTASQSLPAVSLTGEVLIRHRFEAPAGLGHLSRQWPARGADLRTKPCARAATRGG